jgi:hypothetical protein
MTALAVRYIANPSDAKEFFDELDRKVKQLLSRPEARHLCLHLIRDERKVKAILWEVDKRWVNRNVLFGRGFEKYTYDLTEWMDAQKAWIMATDELWKAMTNVPYWVPRGGKYGIKFPGERALLKAWLKRAEKLGLRPIRVKYDAYGCQYRMVCPRCMRRARKRGEIIQERAVVFEINPITARFVFCCHCGCDHRAFMRAFGWTWKFYYWIRTNLTAGRKDKKSADPRADIRPDASSGKEELTAEQKAVFLEAIQKLKRGQRLESAVLTHPPNSN